jgi:hypothetical protein
MIAHLKMVDDISSDDNIDDSYYWIIYLK